MWEKRQFFELTTKKSRQNFSLENIGQNFRKIGIFSTGIENFCDRIHDPQTSNQIDAAALDVLTVSANQWAC